ncbi:MAG TPA: class I SAM-dependent methyltransferase [Gemmataceae bacterium]|jgi:predicted O-methyltransferase YrrM
MSFSIVRIINTKMHKIKLATRLEAKALALLGRAAVLPITALFRRHDRRLLWRLGEICFGSEQGGVYPEVSLASLIDAHTSIRILEMPSHFFNVMELELLALAALTRQAEAQVVFEFGTADGRTTRNLAANLAPCGHVYTLNLPLEDDPIHRQDSPVGHRFQNTAEARQITQLWGNSHKVDLSAYYNRCQVVFIDADHSEAGVALDSQSALHMVDRERGLIIWHDALRYGVRKALPKLMRQEHLPLHLITRTNLAILCFCGGHACSPEVWSRTTSRLRSPCEAIASTKQ